MFFTPQKSRINLSRTGMSAMALFALLISGPLAQATLGDKSTEIVHRLQTNGVKNIGGLSLFQLEKAIKQVKWFALQGRPPIEISANRESAYYDSHDGEVRESIHLPADLELYRPQLELHESLGAIGLPDSQYQITSALSLIDGMGASIDRGDVIKEFGARLFTRQQFAAMGGSSVGGGGDINALAVKTMVLNAIRSTGDRVSVQFFTDFPSVVFEPFYDPEHQFVWMDYHYRAASVVKYAGPLKGAVPKDGYQELLKLHFPALIWQRDPAQRPAIVAKLKEYVLSLYPSTNNYVRSRDIPNQCDPTHPISFPASNDSGIRMIQSLRMSALARCETGDPLFREGDWSMRSPGGDWYSKRWDSK